MEWFIVKIVFGIEQEASSEIQFDEQFRLVFAKDKVNAYEKARKLGEEEAETFFDNNNQEVKWEFVGVESIDTAFILDGSQLMSFTSQPEDPDQYMKYVQSRNQNYKEMIFKDKTHKQYAD